MVRPGAHRFVGIDFGTTYSGVAWAWSERFESPRVVLNWEGPRGEVVSGKVPSAILYHRDGVKWGFGIPPGEKPIQWFKLLLLEDRHMKDYVKNSAYIKEAKEAISRLGKTPLEVVTDYLRLLWRYTIDQMIRVDGEAEVDGQPLKVVITMPAIWPLYAQDRMRDAARDAGITADRIGGPTELQFLAEPEAAALAVMEDANGHPVESGESIVVCDAGGGTVDLITYQLLDTETWRMRECGAGDGDLCGGIFLDQSFDRMMGEWASAKKWKAVTERDKQAWKEKEWELLLKRSFDGAEPNWSIPVPGPLSAPQRISFFGFSKRNKKKRPEIRDNAMQLERSQVMEIFDPVVNKILELVDKQVKNTDSNTGARPKAILLVGGLGQSPYLYHRMKNKYQGSGIEVRRPPHHEAWTAVCRGALLRAHITNETADGGINRPVVVSRVCRTSYGIAIKEIFDPSRHLERDKQWDRSQDKHIALNQVEWYLLKNTDIRHQQTHRLQWEKRVKGHLRMRQFTVTLLRCDRDPPPTRRDPDVFTDCQIICEVDTPIDELPAFTSESGDTYRIIEFEVEMKPDGTTIEFAAWYRNRRQRPVRINPPFAQGPESSANSPYIGTEPGTPNLESRNSPSDLASTPRSDLASSPRSDLASSPRSDQGMSRPNSALSPLDLALTRYDAGSTRPRARRAGSRVSSVI